MALPSRPTVLSTAAFAAPDLRARQMSSLAAHISMTVRLIPYEALKSKGVPYSKPHLNDGEIPWFVIVKKLSGSCISSRTPRFAGKHLGRQVGKPANRSIGCWRKRGSKKPHR